MLTGASPLGDMPPTSEVASLGLPTVAESEDPMLSNPGVSSSGAATWSSAGAKACSLSTSGGKSVEVAHTSGFSLGHGFPLIPAKLVKKIVNWEYVSMAELLPDNLELVRRSAEGQRGQACSSKTPKKRELVEDWKGLVAWSISFDTFVAVVARSHPSKFQQLLAYRATILMEALRFGCKGWLSYDKMFRENIEKDPTANWALLHPMFYSLTFLSQRVEAFTCQRCMAPDHSKSDCALSYLDDSKEIPGHAQRGSRDRHSELGRQAAPPRKRFRREGTPGASTSAGAPPKSTYCFSFNEGQCFRHPKPCDREHKCIRCGKDHRMIDCTATYVLS